MRRNHDEPWLFRLTLWPDGTMVAQGARTESLGNALRILADAADAGRITWEGTDDDDDTAT